MPLSHTFRKKESGGRRERERKRERKIMERPCDDLFLGKPCVNTTNVIAKGDKREQPCPLSVSPSLSLYYLQNSMILFCAQIPFCSQGRNPSPALLFNGLICSEEKIRPWQACKSQREAAGLHMTVGGAAGTRGPVARTLGDPGGGWEVVANSDQPDHCNVCPTMMLLLHTFTDRWKKSWREQLRGKKAASEWICVLRLLLL